MNKAFVIKNKEGKYYQRCYNQSPFTDNLFDANKYQYKEEAEKLLNNSFTLVDTLEVVEITIAEGDLEQENKQLKEQLTEQIDYKEEYYYYWKDTRKENTILKKALELACETIKEIMPNKPMYICGSAIAERLGIQQTSEIKDYDYFIEQAKESMK